MPKQSLEELKGQIAAGEYTVESVQLAGTILSTVGLIRRVKRTLVAEETAEGDAGRGRQPRTRRGSRSLTTRILQPRRERLQ